MIMSEKEIECIKIRFNHYSCVKSTINLILFRVFKSKRINKSNFQIEKCYVPDNKTLFNLYRPYFENGSHEWVCIMEKPVEPTSLLATINDRLKQPGNAA